MTTTIREMTTGDDIAIVRDMMRRYVQWLFDSFPDQTEDLNAYYGPVRVQAALDEVSLAFVPPRGVVLIACIGDAPVGMAMAHPIAPGISEMKRLFVLPLARGKGVGQALIEGLIGRMADWGHPVVRLDTIVFLTDAITLYRRMGFEEIAPYTVLPPGTEKTSLFMERRLDRV